MRTTALTALAAVAVICITPMAAPLTARADLPLFVAKPVGFRAKEFFAATGDTGVPQVSFAPAP